MAYIVMAYIVMAEYNGYGDEGDCVPGGPHERRLRPDSAARLAPAPRPNVRRPVGTRPSDPFFLSISEHADGEHRGAVSSLEAI